MVMTEAEYQELVDRHADGIMTHRAIRLRQRRAAFMDWQMRLGATLINGWRHFKRMLTRKARTSDDG